MRYYHKFAITGFIFGGFGIILGIIALTTPAWISVKYSQSSHTIIYGLFRQCDKNETTECTDINSFQAPQYIEIIGHVILAIGIFVGVICTAFIDQRSIHFIPPIILLIGSLTIFVGFIFYIKCVVEMNHNSSIRTLHFGYSMIMMICTCIIGNFLTAYFSFTAGYIHRHILATVNIYSK
jgi:hypothetical protein